MIVPMFKYSFVVYHREYDSFLDKLSNFGVVDVSVRRDDVDDVIRNKMLLDAQLSDTIKTLAKRNITPVESDEQKNGIDIINEVKDIQLSIDKLNHKVSLLRKEINLAAPWGSYSTDLIKKLHDEGYTIRFFITPDRRFTEELEKMPNLIVINRLQAAVYFVVVQGKDEILDIDADEIKIPAYSPAQLQEFLDQAELEIVQANKKLDYYAERYIPSLDKARQLLKTEIGYRQVMIKTIKHADDKLCVLTGYVPKNSHEELDAYLRSSSVIHYRETPVPDDNPPVLLKNGKFARLFEPIGEIFSLPNYNEMDLTPFFAPFFMMFFGFCMGDFAYGVVLVLAGLLLRNKVSPSMKVFLNLAIFLGIGTMIFGVISGTIAGFEMEKIAFLEPIRGFMLDDQSIFYLALGLGLVQIIYGMMIQAYFRAKQFGFVYALSLIGILIGLFGVIDYLLLKKGGEFSLYAIYAGVALMLFFSDPNLGIFGRIGKGLWDLYSTVTGIFGDVLSYIRLFALGASGGILGYVINSISLPLLDSVPVIGPIMFFVVMIIGHGANIALSGLGSFVHPMRLTFVEFYKNAGFTGGGKKYNPYSK